MPYDRAEVIRHVVADSATQLDHVRALFLEYQRAIGIDLAFQGFEEELATLPGKHAPPAGRLVLAMAADKPAGCVALRPLEPGLCELKRLYVRPPHCSQGLGRRLSTEMITVARQIGYTRMRLDNVACHGGSDCRAPVTGLSRSGAVRPQSPPVSPIL